MTDPTYSYGLPAQITGSGLIFTGAGTLQGIIVSSHTNGTTQFYDNTVASGTILVPTFTFPAGSGWYNFFGVKFKTGLYVMSGGTITATAVFTPYLG